MNKIVRILIMAILIFALIPATAFAHTAQDPFVTDLTAGGGNINTAKDVGDVLVWNDGDNLYVNYVVTDGDWCLTQTHLEIATALEDIPQVKGNPIPGRFTYNDEHACVADFTYAIPLVDWDPETELLIAAHGVVQTGGMDGLIATLPNQVNIGVTFPSLDHGAPLFDIDVSGGTVLDGTYDGYCVDLDGPFVSGTANVFSSYEPLPEKHRIEYPENLDLVNWIINQDFVGQPSGCDGNYTYGDVQWAIWQLVEDKQPASTSSLGDWSQCRAEEIRDTAYANGEGFVPGCGDVMGIILVMEEYWWNQPLLIWVEVPCPEDETVWGGDYFGTPLEFPGDNWAIYFEYTIQ